MWNFILPLSPQSMLLWLLSFYKWEKYINHLSNAGWTCLAFETLTHNSISQTPLLIADLLWTPARLLGTARITPKEAYLMPSTADKLPHLLNTWYGCQYNPRCCSICFLWEKQHCWLIHSLTHTLWPPSPFLEYYSSISPFELCAFDFHSFMVSLEWLLLTSW